MTLRQFNLLPLGLALLIATPVFAQVLKKPDLDTLAASWQGQKQQPEQEQKGFNAFLTHALRINPSLEGTIRTYRDHRRLEGDALAQMGRLLGVYNRAQNQQAVIASIGAMVAIPTVRDPKVPPHESPDIIAFGAYMAELAVQFGLPFRNMDNRIFEITLPGTGTDDFGILTHADVVPVVASEWVMDNGTVLDPFKMVQLDGKLYGRGTIDDKGSIAAVLYAMKTVKDSGIPLLRSVRLMIETTEETGGDAMIYYRAKTALPSYNVVLDSKYPAVVAEKGSGTLIVSLAKQASTATTSTSTVTTAITDMRAAASVSTIPQSATARLQGGDLAAVATQLLASKEAFIRQWTPQGGTFAIDVQTQTEAVTVMVTGVSAHGSRPEEGVNALPRLTQFLQSSRIPFADNEYSQAVRVINGLYGIGYLGESLGVGYTDSFMGPLTISPTVIRMTDTALETIANVRMPRGNTPEALINAIESKASDWAKSQNIAIKINHKQGNWMARDPKGAWLSTLLNIFADTTGLEAKPVPTAGSTTAKLMPNAINFGPAMPGKKYTAHNAREYKEVVDLATDLQMFTEMLVRIGNLPSMQ